MVETLLSSQNKHGDLSGQYEDRVVGCKRCDSDEQQRFSAEMNIHFPHWEGLNKPSVPICREVVICLRCGLAEFSLPEVSLRKLADRTPNEYRSHQE
jgi:hypothetical protein